MSGSGLDGPDLRDDADVCRLRCESVRMACDLRCWGLCL